tara:strand:+ start:462 stop:608 length:147 start_codon:yes stop_codon:yes gene_type:complete
MAGWSPLAIGVLIAGAIAYVFARRQVFETGFCYQMRRSPVNRNCLAVR